MNGKENWGKNILRSAFGTIDWICFEILGWVYTIFFDITTVEFFSSETIRNFYGRIQLILGVLMVFKISISILQAIVEPDKMSDKNGGGFTSIVKRVVMCLVMLTLLMPVNLRNVDSNNDFYTQVNNNGILFGTLYSMQHRIMNNNTLGKLILGKKSDGAIETAGGNSTEQAMKMNAIKNDFVSNILKGFLDLKPNSACESGNEAYDAYNASSVTPKQLLSEQINTTCGDNYAFYYYPFIGGVVAIGFSVILVGFSVDIAVRALKLALLRLLAPIPIISYIDPNKEKDGAFGNWVKILTSVYLDLFIRLAIVYFVIFLIADIMKNGIVIGADIGKDDIIMKTLIFCVICFGLFVFAKQAPKFIQDVLGLKGTMQNVGLASILGGTAMALGGGGLAGFGYGLMNGANGQIDAANQGKQAPLMGAWSSNRDLMAKIRTGDKDAQGGVMGSLHDRLNYNTREKAANRLGLSKENQALADFNKDRAEKQAAVAQRNLDFARQKATALHATDQGIKLSKFRNDDGSWKSEDAKQIAYKRYGEDAVNTQVVWDDYQKAYDAANEAQMVAAKAAGNAESIDKARNQLGVSARVVDKYRSTYRSGKDFDHNADNNTYGYSSSAKPFDPMKGSPDTRLSDDQVIYGGGNGAMNGSRGGPPPRH